MKALFGQTAVDITLEKFGSLDFLAKVISDNNLNLISSLSNIDLVIDSVGYGDERKKRYLLNFTCINNSETNEQGLYIISEDGLFIITENGEKIQVG